MDKAQIFDLLKTVTYPGFTRDIVSFGMVRDIMVAGDIVTVTLKISGSQEEKKQVIRDNVLAALEASGKFSKVNVELEEIDTPQATSTGDAEQSEILNGEVKNIIAIASGKGGVGKSTIAVNIAAILAEKGNTVGLLDLDIYGPSLPIILGLNQQPQITPDRKLVPIEHLGMKVMSFGFLSGNDVPVIWRGPMIARMTAQFFSDVTWGRLDYLILDLPPGTGDVQLTLTQKIKLTGAIIVTTPQDIALADVRKGADMFRKVNTPVLGVIENMSGLQISGRILDTDGEAIAAAIHFDGEDPVQVDETGAFDYRYDLFKRGGGEKESRRLGVPLLGEIPISRDIVAATDAGTPIVLSSPDSPLTAIYHEIVKCIEDHINE